MTPPRRDLDPPPGLPLCQGASGEPVRDLQRRLSRAGLPVTPDAPGSFGDATEAAVSAFQGRSGLEVTGICDGLTWSVLVEAGYQLGDRLLYHRTPMLRGDDVTALQRPLSLRFHRCQSCLHAGKGEARIAHGADAGRN